MRCILPLVAEHLWCSLCALPLQQPPFHVQQVNRRSNTRHDKAHLWRAPQINGFNSAHNLATMYLCVARAEQRRRHFSVIACMECNYPAQGNGSVSGFLCQICTASLHCPCFLSTAHGLTVRRNTPHVNQTRLRSWYVRKTVHYKKETGRMCLCIFRSKFYHTVVCVFL